MSTYRFSAAMALRLLGGGVSAVGLAVLVWLVVAVLASVPDRVFGAGLLVGLLLFVLVVASTAVLRRQVVVRFDEVGYRVRLVRGCGVRQARWKLVEDVAATMVGGGRCVVLRLSDGRTTTVPVDLLATTTEHFVADLRTHLDRGHGYRRFAPVPGDR